LFLRKINSYGEALSYDKHGNITSLARGGITVHNWVGGSAPTPNHTFYDVDQLIYYYNGNQVKSISDNSSGALYTGAQDFKDNASTMDEYGYDANGNQTKDLNKKIVTMRYNSLNLPDTIQLQSGHMVSYVYDPMGQKESVTRKVVVTSGISIPVGKTLSTAGIAYTSTTSLIQYASNVVYGGTYGTTITDILLPDGLLKPFSTGSLTFTYNYYIRDHLGNVRAVIDGAGTIKQANNYNPFGMEYGESAESQTLTNYQNYQYSGKEFDRKLELNLYDFGARFYDATRGQWTTPDPLAALNYAVSPYVYCSNNPLNRIDPTGMVDEKPVYGGQLPEPNVKGTYTGNSGAFDSGANTSFFNSSINDFIDLYALSESQKTSFLAYTNGADGRARENNSSANGSWATLTTALGLTVDWALGTGANNRTFSNDAVAYSFSNARVINQARKYWYSKVNSGKISIYGGVTNFLGKKAFTGGNFGVKGLISAGFDPMEQFVGSFTPTISSNGRNLTFTIQNTTSFKSLMGSSSLLVEIIPFSTI